MTSQLRIGMIGAGRMAHLHAELLIDNEPGVEIVAVFSRTEEHAALAAAEWDAKPYTDYRRLLDENELDAVYICTPTFIHVEIGLECAERGLHMFVEKPLDLDLTLSQRLVDAVESRGLINVTAFHWRYTEAYHRAQELMADDPIALVNLRWYWTRPPMRWMWDRSQAGGQIVDQNIHLIDLSRGLAGEIDTIYAAYNREQVNFDEGFDSWDGYALTLRYINGAVGNCAGTYGLFPEIQLGPAADFALRDRLVRLTAEDVTHYTPEGIQTWQNHEPFHLGVNRAFIDAVRRNDMTGISTPLRSGLWTTAATLAANHSAESGTVVDLSTFLVERTTIG
jgi:myo-inositol 2-dehydrogenase/D-chiro-inositol 1-dehydrogenase